MSDLPLNGFGFLKDRTEWGEGWPGVIQVEGRYYALSGEMVEGDFGRSVSLRVLPIEVCTTAPRQMYGITPKRAEKAAQHNSEADLQF